MHYLLNVFVDDLDSFCGFCDLRVLQTFDFYFYTVSKWGILEVFPDSENWLWFSFLYIVPE